MRGWAYILLLGLGPACSLNFDVELIDQKTALENQILTEMRHIREDLILLSEVRAVRESPAIEAGRWEAFLALQNRMYNQDDLDRLKDLGYVGEDAMGMVAEIENPPDAPKTERVPLLKRVTLEENRDRLIVMRYLLQRTDRYSGGDLKKIQRVMGNFNRDSAKTGHWIQTPEGEWRRKS